MRRLHAMPSVECSINTYANTRAHLLPTKRLAPIMLDRKELVGRGRLGAAFNNRACVAHPPQRRVPMPHVVADERVHPVGAGIVLPYHFHPSDLAVCLFQDSRCFLDRSSAVDVAGSRVAVKGGRRGEREISVITFNAPPYMWHSKKRRPPNVAVPHCV